MRVNYTSSGRASGGVIRDIVLGGGMIETFAFGSNAPKDGESGDRTVEVEPPDEPFSLAAAVAISSSMQSWIQRKVWPVLPQGVSSQEAIMHQLGDGGIMENSGLLPLLQRGATKAVTVISSSVALDPAVDFCESRSEMEWADIIEPCGKAACTLTALFGYTYINHEYDYSHDQVFDRSAMPAVLCNLQQRKRVGEPTVSLQTLRVQSNDWWGIKGGFDLELLIVYLDECTDFDSSLPADTRGALQSDARLSRHPHYATATYLEHPITSLLAAMSEYFVRQNADLFRSLLN